MHFERIFLQTNFQCSPMDNPFLYKTIGVGVFVKEGENIKEAEEEAEKYIAEYIQRKTIYPTHNHIEERIIYSQPLPEIQVDKGKSLEEEIRNCTTEDELKKWFLLAHQNEVTTFIYRAKLKQLQS